MTTKPKTVCIVGAGPSGLVAAKTLIHDHPKDTFHVTIFEALDRIGGLWPVSETDQGMINPDMCTNQSKHTVSFSDLAWAEEIPSFPKAWQVGQYLERYIKTYPGYEIRKNTRIVKAEQDNGRWRVQTQASPNGSSGQVQNHEFDHLIITSGFFGKPKIPDMLRDFSTPVFHSSQVRDVKSLLTDNHKTLPAPGRNIVVVGGQMSGVEIAASIALQVSSAENSPGAVDVPEEKTYKIIHVVQNPVWVMPLFFPNNPNLDTKDGTKKPNPSPNFLPVDLVTYNLGWKPPGPIENSSGHISEDAARMTHDFMNTYIGSDQSDLGTQNLAMTGEVRTQVPYLAVSDQYTEFVRSGKIKTIRGKVTGTDKTAGTLLVKDGQEQKTIEDVAAVIFATGYNAAPSLDFLPKDLLSSLQFDPQSDAFPLALNIHSTVNAALPSLGFVGFYRSPYWGVMEMQARCLGTLWSDNKQAAQALAEDETLSSMLALRSDPRRAQFPMGDYAHLMESFASILDIQRVEPKGSTGRTGLVLPSRYFSPTASALEIAEAEKARDIITSTMHDSTTKGRFVARAAFRAMQGDWKLERTITSRIASYPSGTLSGEAEFRPRAPTEMGVDMEYLYLENGEFSASNGFSFSAKRSYAHRYTSTTDTLSVWFTKADHKTVDYLFHELEFTVPLTPSTSEARPWKAKSSHLCIEDLYDVAYEFWFQGTTLREWCLEYSVRGPAKDYTIRSVYRR
ncbi:flavin-containing monooxygenase-like protein [Halenospora varia]|nr:flavin-containing monooxygenase-like protein [Halenospora varia]